MNDTQQPPAKGGSSLKWILLGCFGCAGIVALGFFGLLAVGVVGGAAIVKATEGARLDAKQFLAQAGSGDVDGAYNHFSSALKAKISKEDFKTMVEKNPDLFQVTDSTFNDVGFMNEVTKIKGTVIGKSGKVHNALFRYIKEGSDLKMVEFILRDDPIGAGE